MPFGCKLIRSVSLMVLYDCVAVLVLPHTHTQVMSKTYTYKHTKFPVLKLLYSICILETVTYNRRCQVSLLCVRPEEVNAMCRQQGCVQDTCMYLANAMLLDAATVNDIHAFKYCTCTSSGDQSIVASIVMYPASSNTLWPFAQ